MSNPTHAAPGVPERLLPAGPLRRVDSELSIARQIAAPGSNFLCACLSSTIDGFTNGINVGNTLYHVYRSPAVREARVPGRIWHWAPVAGRYWMGLVMVDSPGAVETVRVILRERELAPVVASLGDGRRHLYYWPAAFDFEFAETLEMLTPADDAPYIIEGFLFTPAEPYDEPLEVRASPALLDAPAFASGMLPDAVRIENPGAHPGRRLVTTSLALPGVKGVTATLAGTACPTCLCPLTTAPDGTPINQQLQVLADLPATPECTLHLALGPAPAPPPANVEISADETGLRLPNGLTATPVMPGASLALRRVPGWCGENTLQPGFTAVFALSASQAELEITLTVRVTPGTDTIEIEHALLVLGPGEFATLPALALEIHGTGATGRELVRADGPEPDGEPVVGNGRWALAAADFAAMYPAVLRAEDGLLAWDLLPPGWTPPNLSRRERDQRFFYIGTDGYRFRRGFRRRHRCFVGPVREQVAACLEPPRPVLPRSLRAGLVTPAPPPPDRLRWRSRTLAAWQRQQRELHGFGFPNYGDWFGERFCNWGNGEYDTPYGLLLQAMHTADAAWVALGHASARHLLEVDTAHLHPTETDWQYRHSMGHTSGYFTDSYEVGAYGSLSDPGDVSHNWVEGVLLHYLLTGDDLALQTARALLEDLAGPVLATTYFSNGRNMGWHLIHLVAGAAILRDPRYLDAARALVRLILERQRPDGSWRRVLSSDHCRCYPQHTGNAGFMVGILMEGLAKYHQLTGDARVADAIVRAGQFLWRDIRDPDTGRWRYTSCPNTSWGEHGGSEIHWLAPMCYVARLGLVDPALASAWEAAAERYLEGYIALLEKPLVIARGHEAPGKFMSKALRLVPPQS